MKKLRIRFGKLLVVQYIGFYYVCNILNSFEILNGIIATTLDDCVGYLDNWS